MSERERLESELYERWAPALESDGGIADEHAAYTTAIVLENYFNYLSRHPILIAEDKMQTDAFTGVNLALIGIIRRVIPEILAANELVGMQAMPTPKSPIFTMQFYRDDAKGNTLQGQEIWKPYTQQPTEIGETFDYSSGAIKEVFDVAAGMAGLVSGVGSNAQQSNGTFQIGTGGVIKLNWALRGNQNRDKASGFIPDQTAFVLPGSINIVAKDGSGNVTYRGYFAGSPYGSGSENAVETPVAPVTVTTPAVLTYGANNSAITITPPVLSVAPASLEVSYEISFEGDANQPEMTFKITDQTIGLIKRMLRGRYTLDSAFDVNVLHGINLENEMTNMIKLDLTNGISREIIDDLRKMAGIRKNLDMNAYVSGTPGMSTYDNYNDAYLVMLDWINRLSAEIANRTRLSRGNWVVANPVTISFLDRVPGFVGSGVNGNERGIGYVGHLGGRLKFYADPQYPIGEFLIGRKGTTPSENGYLHCPYLPITASPTMHNQLTGDPIKIFYTRYGKTFRAFNKETKKFNDNVILNGENHYARLVVTSNTPNFTAQALTPANPA